MKQRFPNLNHWYVYIISNNAHTLYVGCTVDLPRRIYQHKTRFDTTSFTARYTFDRCVYFDLAPSRASALKRERQIKGWSRRKKVALIQSPNPNWIDLSSTWPEALMLH